MFKGVFIPASPKELERGASALSWGERMPGDMTWMKTRFDELSEKSLLWEPPTLESPNQPRCQMNGKPTIMLSANN